MGKWWSLSLQHCRTALSVSSKINSMISPVFPQADSPPPSAETQKNLRFNLPDSNKQTEQSITGVSIQPSGTYPLGRSLSSSPRSSPDPQEQSIGRRVDSRYQTDIPVRHSLTQAYHEKTGKREPYTMAQVLQADLLKFVD